MFGAGWSRRVAAVRSISLRMMAQTRPSPSIVTEIAPAPGKGAVPAPRCQESDCRHQHCSTCRGGRQPLGLDCGASLGDGRNRVRHRPRHRGSIYVLSRWHQRAQEAAIPKPLSFLNSLSDRRTHHAHVRAHLRDYRRDLFGFGSVRSSRRGPASLSCTLQRKVSSPQFARSSPASSRSFPRSRSSARARRSAVTTSSRQSSAAST